MESLPPIAPRPRLICAYKAPNSAAVGTPQRFLSSRRRIKNSCKVRRMSSIFAPAATTLETEVTIEYIAPVKGDEDISSGLYPYAETVQSSVSPPVSFAAIAITGVS